MLKNEILLRLLVWCVEYITRDDLPNFTSCTTLQMRFYNKNTDHWLLWMKYALCCVLGRHDKDLVDPRKAQLQRHINIMFVIQIERQKKTVFTQLSIISQLTREREQMCHCHCSIKTLCKI